MVVPERCIRRAFALGVLMASTTVPVLAQGNPVDVATAVDRDYDVHLEQLFVHFHENPELSFLETNTAARIADELRATGLEVTEHVGGTGVVGILHNGEGPLILLRADMDGLPIWENSGLTYSSHALQVDIDGLEKPVMHACGHDAHITSLVGTARQLAAMRDDWSGTLMFVAQPAEERLGGARAMLEDGLYERFGTPDYALAYHVSSLLPTGTIVGPEAIAYASADSVEISVPGIGTHGGSPHLGRDPIYIGAQIVTALQSVISREISPLAPGVITVGSFHAGTKHNIIPDAAELQLTVRANDETTRAQILAAIERIAVNTALAHGMPEDRLPVVTVSEGTPVANNDPALAARLNAVMAETFGTENLLPFEQMSMAAEDFTYFANDETGVPGYYFFVGGARPEDLAAAEDGGQSAAGHHSPFFRIAPRETVTLGSEAMVAAVLELAPRK